LEERAMPIQPVDVREGQMGRQEANGGRQRVQRDGQVLVPGGQWGIGRGMEGQPGEAETHILPDSIKLVYKKLLHLPNWCFCLRWHCRRRLPGPRSSFPGSAGNVHEFEAQMQALGRIERQQQLPLDSAELGLLAVVGDGRMNSAHEAAAAVHKGVQASQLGVEQFDMDANVSRSSLPSAGREVDKARVEEEQITGKAVGQDQSGKDL